MHTFERSWPLMVCVTVLAFSMISGCGQGGGNADPASVSLKGTDADNNGVRDEVESAITKSYGVDTPIANAGITLAKSYQTWFDEQDPSAERAKELVVEELRLSRCLSKLNTAGAAMESATAEIQIRTFNTRQRLQVRANILEKAGAFLIPSESAGCAL